jgi:hypothetical protein
MLLSDTLAVAAAGLVTTVVVHHHTQQQRRAAHAQRTGEIRSRRAVYRYREPLPVPVGPQFDLDLFNDIFCIEYFR